MNQLQALLSLTSVSQADFKLLYHDVIQQSKAFNDECHTDFIKDVIKALKRRRAYLLPLQADSETIYRQQDAWTYVVFVASVWRYHPDINDIDALQKLIPTNAWQWLQQYDEVYQALVDYGNGAPTILTTLVAPYEQISQTVIPESFSPAASTQTDKAISTPQFFTWLQDKMNDNVLAFVHRVEAGYFVELPRAWEQYQTEQSDKQATLDELYHSERLIVTKGGVLHHYCLGDWQKRQTLQGILIKPDSLPALKTDWQITNDLQPDPMAAALATEC